MDNNNVYQPFDAQLLPYEYSYKASCARPG